MTGEEAKRGMTPTQLKAVKAMEDCGYSLTRITQKHLEFDAHDNGSLFFFRSWIVITLDQRGGNAIHKDKTSLTNYASRALTDKEMRAILDVIGAFKGSFLR